MFSLLAVKSGYFCPEIQIPRQKLYMYSHLDMSRTPEFDQNMTPKKREEQKSATGIIPRATLIEASLFLGTGGMLRLEGEDGTPLLPATRLVHGHRVRPPQGSGR